MSPEDEPNPALELSEAWALGYAEGYSEASESSGLREAAQELVDYEEGGGFRANHPSELFSALRAALASLAQEPKP